MQQQLDPGAVNLAKAIRQTESGGNFTIQGKSGEYGAYQFTPDTWNAEAPKYGINVPLTQSTPEQQNEVAYKKIKEWKDAGHNVGQIASMWNAGQSEPDAYTGQFSNGQPSAGVNSHNVKFDVPTYAKSVATAYQQIKAGQQVGADSQNPSSVANPQNAPGMLSQLPQMPQPPADTPDPTQNIGGGVGDFIKGLAGAPATMLARPFQAGAELLGASPESVDAFSNKYSGGLVAPVPQNYGDVMKDVGRGIQTAGMGIPSLAAGGATIGLGSSLEQGNDLFSLPTAFETVLGGAGSKVLGLIGKPLMSATGAVIGKVTPQILQDVASKGSQAIEDFAAKYKILPDSISKPLNALVNPPITNTAYSKAVSKVADAYDKSLPLTPTQRVAEADLLKKTGTNASHTAAIEGWNIGDQNLAQQMEDTTSHLRSATKDAASQETARFDISKVLADAESGLSSFASADSRNSAKAEIQKQVQAILAEHPSDVITKDGVTTVSSKVMEQIRQAGNEIGRYDMGDVQGVKMNAGRSLANAVRDRVEADGTFPSYRAANKKLAEVIHAKETIGDLLDSGKQFKRIGGLSGAIASKILGGAAGLHAGGLGGMVLGELGTGYAAEILSNPRMRTYFSRKLIEASGEKPSAAIAEKLKGEVEAFIQKQRSTGLPAKIPGRNYSTAMEMGGKPVIDPQSPNINRTSSLQKQALLPPPSGKTGAPVAIPPRLQSAVDSSERANVQRPLLSSQKASNTTMSNPNGVISIPSNIQPNDGNVKGVISAPKKNGDLSQIKNPIDPSLSPQEKVKKLAQLTEENKPKVAAIIKDLQSLGLESSDNVKDPAKILAKASRPDIKEKKPWFDVEHVRDSYRFKAKMNDLADAPKIVEVLKKHGVQVVKLDTEKMTSPGAWGWRFAAWDLKMPNGQLVEFYAPIKEVGIANDGETHGLFEKWRNTTHAYRAARKEEYAGDLIKSNRLYGDAWNAYLKRTSQTAEEAADRWKTISDSLSGN